MSSPYTEEFACDLCGSSDSEVIPAFAEYHREPPYHTCRTCGLIYIRRRRSSKAIADTWSNRLYQNIYTARLPAIHARQIYVADFVRDNAELKGQSLCDIGAGEGQFLEIIRSPEYGSDTFGIEPSQSNCDLMDHVGIRNFCGTIEDYAARISGDDDKFDVVTIMWTLENCQSARAMLDTAWDILKDGGKLFIATGSRILVPFKKPLHYFVGFGGDERWESIKNDQWGDTHPYHFSANALNGFLAVSGFKPEYVNRYFDTDYLVVGGIKTDRSSKIEWKKDDYKDVIDFCDRWNKESKTHFSHF
jgi:SAM-dependent methyltransferase